MPSRLTYPGVYVEEKRSGSRTITGVSTSTALFIGMARRGPIDQPVAVRSFDMFEERFGDDKDYGEMAVQVQQFFVNGGAEAIIVRTAKGADRAKITLRSAFGTGTPAGQAVLTLTAVDAGLLGNEIRAFVDYNTVTPELTFNLRLFREVVNPLTGALSQTSAEDYSNLSMDVSASNYVETAINSRSILVEAKVETFTASGTGFSQSGVVLDGSSSANTLADIAGLIPDPAESAIRISVDSGAPVTVTLPDPTTAASYGAWRGDLKSNIDAALMSASQSSTVNVPNENFGGGTVIRVESTAGTGGSVVITSASANDAAAPLELGTSQGGIEISSHSRWRPAPSGYVSRLSTETNSGDTTNSNLNRLEAFGNADPADLAALRWEDSRPTSPHDTAAISYSGTPANFLEGTASSSGQGSLRNVAEHLQTLVSTLNNTNAFKEQWIAERHGLRIAIYPLTGNANNGDSVVKLSTATGAYDIGASANLTPESRCRNTAAYSLGPSGTMLRQAGNAPGTDGNPPDKDEYDGLYGFLGKEIDIFNILLLPRGHEQDDGIRSALWGPASAFCRQQRAFLIIDPKSDNGDWDTVDDVVNDITNVRTGVVGDHSAIYWPRLAMTIGSSRVYVDPCGTVAGIAARTDVRRGIWKAPAGLEANTLGAMGLQYLVDDADNGVTNPQAINTLRQFATGSVLWGARTLAGFDNSGEDDYRYVPVRRLALYIEESLYRGLAFAVFEPNDEPLWAQIRVAAGGFMQNLYRQGAFQGEKKSDAYQVLCDADTTTQNDINLGRVNVVVKFAPLKPAEFVVLIIQQLAGQVQT